MKQPSTGVTRRALARGIVCMAVVLVSVVCSSAISGQPAANFKEDSYAVLFLAADRPLCLTLRLTGTQSGIDAVRKRYTQLLIQAVDADGDGFADEAEAPRLPSSGRPAADAQPLGERWLSFDTSPADGRLSADELLRAMEPILGPRFTTRRKPPLLVQSVQLLPRLDQDRDRRVSEAEIQRATQTLGQFDFDDDGTFSPAELQPFPQSMVEAVREGERGSDQPFVLLDESLDLGALIERLLTLYGDGSGVSRERTGLSEFAFGELDRDGNARLDQAELPALVEHPRPVAEISINLQAGRVALERPRHGSQQVELLPVEAPQRLALRLGSEVVEFSAHDNRYEASDQINLLRIRFLQSDADKNGYVERPEFLSLAGMTATFEEVDGDGDGRVFLDELDRFVRIDSYLAQCAVEMQVEAVEKPLFRILDENLDRRLTAREFATGSRRLAEFDRDGDGILDETELDALRRFRVRFGFVVPPAVRPLRTLQMANRRMPVLNRMAQTGPLWFQKMDRNQDGELAWREFLGPRDAFDRLDRDGSGWIDEAEAAR